MKIQFILTLLYMIFFLAGCSNETLSNEAIKKEKSMNDTEIRNKIDKILLEDKSQINSSKDNLLTKNQKLIELMGKIDNILEQYPVQPNKPLSNIQIENLNIALHPNQLPEDLIALYQWHDGIYLNDGLVTVFAPMQIALFEYYMNLSENMEDEEYNWKNNHFPIHTLDDTGMGYLDIKKKKHSSIYFHTYNENIIQKYPSIERILEIFLITLEKKLVYFDEKNKEWNQDRFLRLLMENEDSILDKKSGTLDTTKMYELLQSIPVVINQLNV